MNSAKTARRMMAARTSIPTTAPRFSENEAQNARRGLGASGMTGTVSTMVMSAAMTDPRVDRAVKHVDGEVDDDDDARNEEDATLKGRIISSSNRLDEPFPDARPGEDGLGEHCARHQRANLQADDRHDGDECVP